MSPLIRQINAIIFDTRLFSDLERAEYQNRMKTDDLETILFQVKELEQARWKEYQETKFQAA
jgi:hypothetical protein